MIIAIDNLKADRNKRLFFTEQQEQREQLTSRSKPCCSYSRLQILLQWMDEKMKKKEDGWWLVKIMNISLCEKWPNTEVFLVRNFPYSVQIWENTDQKKLRIWTLFTWCVTKSKLMITVKTLEEYNGSSS